MEKPADATFREITCERLVIREPGEGRIRALAETVPPGSDGPRAYGVRLVLFDGCGEPAVTAEVDASGEPMVTIGPRDSGTSVVVTAGTVDLWRGENAVLTVTAGEDGGRIEVLDEIGETVASLPPDDGH